MKRILTILITLTLIFGLLGCTNTANTVNTSKGFTVTDSTGAKIAFEKSPNKIISLLPSDTEIIYALKAQDKIIAVSNLSKYPVEASKKAQLDSGDKTNIEAIIGLKPDVILISKMTQTQAQIKQLQDAGIKVVVTDPQNIASAYNIINIIGKICGKDKEAGDMVLSMKKDFDMIKEQTKGVSKKKVYLEISPLQYGLWTCGKGTFQQEIMDMCGITNIFSDLNGWKSISEEQVISKNPDIILTTTDTNGLSKDPIVEIKSRKNWSNISAIKNNKVFSINVDLISQPGPRLVLGAKALMKAIYGK